MSFLSYDQALAYLLQSKVNSYSFLYNRTIPDKLIKEKHGWTDLPTGIKGFIIQRKKLNKQATTIKKKEKRKRRKKRGKEKETETFFTFHDFVHGQF